MAEHPPRTPEDLEPAIRRAASGDEAAWSELARALAPRIESMAKAHAGLRSRGLSGSADDVAEIVTSSLERLSSKDMENLRRYCSQRDAAATKRPQSFDSWLYGAVDFGIREHLRRRFGRRPQATGGAEDSSPRRPSKRDLNTLSGRLDDEIEPARLETLGLTRKVTLAQVLRHIEEAFEPAEARAIVLHYAEEKSFAEIAERLGLPSEKEAERLIRKLNARLRYRFSTKG